MAYGGDSEEKQRERKEGFEAEEQHWATLTGKDLASAIFRRFEDHLSRLKSSGRDSRMRRSWTKYYSHDADGKWEGGGDSTEIGTAGVQGELTTIRPNRYRARVKRILNMAVGAAPAYESQSINTDADAMRECVLSDGLIDFYLHRHKLQVKRRERAEAALVFSEAWAVSPWDPNRGRFITYEDRPETDDKGKPIKGKTRRHPVFDGEFRFLALTPYDVATAPRADDPDNPPWAIYRFPANRYDYAALYPDHKEEILALPSFSECHKDLHFLPDDIMSDDTIVVYHAVHEISPSAPEGLSAFAISPKTIILSGGLEYDTVGGLVSRCAPSNVLLQQGGYTPGYDLLPLAEAHNATVSTVLTNQTATGVQVFLTDKNSGIKRQDLGKGLAMLTINPGARFEAVNLTRTAPETFTFLEVLEAEEDLVTALNPAARGDVQASKGDSGAKSALMVAASQQMQSDFAESIQFSDEQWLTHIIKTLQTHATVERIATIAGKYNTYASREFKGQDIEKIVTVLVRKGNPMRDTSEGRVQLLGIYKELGLLQSPEQVWTVLETGRLDPLSEGVMADIMLARKENEVMRDGGDDGGKFEAIVSPIDAHGLHIREHKSLLADPRVRLDGALVQRVKAHIDQHVAALQGAVNPGLLLAIGEKPIPPMPPGAMPPGAGPGGPPPPPAGGKLPTDDGMPDVPAPAKNPMTGDAPMQGGGTPPLGPVG